MYHIIIRILTCPILGISVPSYGFITRSKMAAPFCSGAEAAGSPIFFIFLPESFIFHIKIPVLLLSESKFIVFQLYNL